ncbi:MAG: putative metal-binding motif-containing protein [Myxococcaceae bacterium]|nr:putative metal-binding motif-containing protein [Myxococcaceae bacterium]
MPRRILWILPAATLLAAGCGKDGPGSGAARAVIAWHDVTPRCLRLIATPQDGDPKVSEVPLENASPNGQKVIAVYRAEGWGPDVTLTAQAFEGTCAQGQVVAQKEQSAHITTGVVEVTFELTAKDADRDGYVDANAELPGTDCADSDPAIHPGANEVCNMKDDDCDGAVDEGVKLQLYWDGDHDGFGAGPVFEGCSPTPDWVADNTDCDDERADVHPGLPEVCNGIDDNCSGEPDEGLVLETFYVDQDGDGFGDPARPVMACMQGPGMVTDNTDCDDDPQAGGASAHPGGTEVCDTFDNDCDGMVDDGVRLTFFVDADGDGFGDETQPTVMACSAPKGYSEKGGDCDDSPTVDGPSRHPGAAEICNVLDDDCDTQVDEGVKSTFYRDQDNDGYGDALSSVDACTPPPGYVADATDCNDTPGPGAAIHPGAAEVCNGVDDNCAGGIDEGVLITWYRDLDGDTFGDPNNSTTACTQPAGFVQDNTDCDDTNLAIHLNAPETCNYVDDNCNGQVDEGQNAPGYFDQDHDGVGGAAGQGCLNLPGFLAAGGDCDDGNPFNMPGGTEVCDQIDNDCDGVVDNGVTCTGSDWVEPGNTGGGGHNYHRLAIVQSGAWAAGEGALRYFPGNNDAASNYDGACGGTKWHSITADFLGGTAYFGDDSSRLGSQTPGGSSCSGQTSFKVNNNNVDLRGMAFVYDLTSGLPSVYGVSDGGHLFRWSFAGGSTVTEVGFQAGSFFDFDGLWNGWMFAVGAGPVSTVEPYIVLGRSPTDWVADPIDPTLTFTPGQTLRAVSVALYGYAAAVGDGALVLVRDPSPTSGPNQWTKLPDPPGANDLMGVKCFGKNLIYVVGTGTGTGTVNGYGLWRWSGNPASWTLDSTVDFQASKTPRDIDGASPDNLWIVGLKGFVRHWTHP